MCVRLSWGQWGSFSLVDRKLGQSALIFHKWFQQTTNNQLFLLCIIKTCLAFIASQSYSLADRKSLSPLQSTSGCVLVMLAVKSFMIAATCMWRLEINVPGLFTSSEVKPNNVTHFSSATLSYMMATKQASYDYLLSQFSNAK